MSPMVLTILLVGVCALLLFVIFKKSDTFQTPQRDLSSSYTGAQGIGGEAGVAIDQAIQDLPVSAQDRAKTRVALKNAVEKEVEKKASIVREEVKKHYEYQLQQKDAEVQQTVKKFTELNQQYEVVQQEYKKVEVEKKQTETVVNSIAEGMVVVNEKGEMLMMNPAAEKLLGIKANQAVGKPLQERGSDERYISLSKDSGSGEKEITVQSGSEETAKTIRSSSAVIKDEQGRTVGMVSMLTDITKQKELDEMKTRFVSSVTHELRTPLHAIQESVHMLLDKVLGEINPKQEKILNLTARNIERLSRLINDVLDVAKMESGKMELKASTFKIDALIYQVISTFEAWTKSKGVTIRPRLSEDPVEIEADHDRLVQVFTNLIGNAMKFTPTGGTITVGAKLASNDTVECFVEDTGPGIPEEMRKKIFEKFVQVKGTTGGTGLGLTISKELVQLHKGTIWVESEVGKGSRFLFSIPRRVQK